METPNPTTARTPDDRPVAPGPETRQFERHDFQLEVSAQNGHQFFTGFSENISAGGLFVATHDVQPLGSRFGVTFKVPELDRTFTARCEVRWIRPHHAGSGGTMPGMGVRFIDMDPEDQRALDEVLGTLETLFYD